MRLSMFALLLCSFSSYTLAAEAQTPVPTPNHGMIHAPVTSYYEMRFENVVRQALDLSCGAAALATLMKYHFGMETTEKEITERILANAREEERAKIAEAGFSMLELKREGERSGFTVGGFRLESVQNLTGLRVPAITLTQIRGYNHFVVIKGVRQGLVHIADPAFGNRTRTLDQFADGWNNVVLVFVDQDRPAKSAFSFDDVNVTPTREIVVFTDRFLRGISRGSGEF